MIDIKYNRDVSIIASFWCDCVKDFFQRPCRPWKKFPEGRRYFNSYGEKLKYECMRVVSDSSGGHLLELARLGALDSWWQHLEDILLVSPETMEIQIKKWEKKKIGQPALLAMIKDILVTYYDLVSAEYGHILIYKLNIRTCPYCNRQFIYSFTGRAPERPELDHFYPKNKYPLYCLSFYNLIPSCHSCNHVKMEEEIGVNPYKRAFKSSFILVDQDDKPLTKSELYKKEEDEIRLRFHDPDTEEKKNIEVLGLEHVYNRHTNYVKELIDKSMAYDKYARDALVSAFQGAGYHPQQVYDFVWGRHLMDAEYEDRPLSKLTKEILDNLEI